MCLLSWTAARGELTRRLAEPAPGRVQLVTGPRRSGKTTLARDVAAGAGLALVHARGDFIPRQSVPPLPDAWRLATQAARECGRALLVIDDIHFVKGWQAWLRGAWARARAAGVPLHVLLVGSGVLDGRLAASSREWLEVSRLARPDARSLADSGQFDEASAVEHLVWSGARPASREDEARGISASFRAEVVAPALEQDIPAVVALRAPSSLRALLDACAAAATRIVTLGELRAASGLRVSLETVGRYLRLLEDARLVATLPELGRDRWSPRDARVRLVPLDNALLGTPAPTRGPQPVAAVDPAFALRVRNACLAHAWAAGHPLRCWSEGRLEVDAVFDDGRRRQLLLVAVGPVEEPAMEGLLELCGRLPSYQPVLVGDAQARAAAEATDIDWIDWRDYLMTNWTSPGP